MSTFTHARPTPQSDQQMDGGAKPAAQKVSLTYYFCLMLHFECDAGTLLGHSPSALLFPCSLPPRSSQALYTEDMSLLIPGLECGLRGRPPGGDSAQRRGCPAEQSQCLGWEERRASLSFSLKGAASNKTAGARPGSLRLSVMETLSLAEQAPRRSPGPGQFGCLLCPGGNSGCLAQSHPLSVKSWH